jgi:hypothetical protein
LEWDRDDGLGKLWGLYYKCPDMQFILRVKAALRNGFDPSATAMTTSLSITGQEYVLPSWQYEIKHIKPYGKPELISTLTNQICPCIACNNHKNINNPSTWVPVFLRKSGITTWGLFDKFFEELIPDFEWGSNEGLENFWGAYYRYPDAESIQRIMETRMDKKVVRKECPPSLGGASFGLSAKSPVLQTSDDASATATMFTSTIISSSPGTAASISNQVSNKQTSDLQLA